MWDHTIFWVELHDFLFDICKSCVFTRENLTNVLIFHTILRVIWKNVLKAKKLYSIVLNPRFLIAGQYGFGNVLFKIYSSCKIPQTQLPNCNSRSRLTYRGSFNCFFDALLWKKIISIMAWSGQPKLFANKTCFHYSVSYLQKAEKIFLVFWHFFYVEAQTHTDKRNKKVIYVFSL